MAKRKKAQTRLAAVFNALADDRSTELFRRIAASGSGTTGPVLKAELKLTRKQFYSRLASLTQAGLVRRREGRYVLSSLGRVMNDIMVKAQNALDIELRLKAIDSVLAAEDVSEQERKQLVEELVGEGNQEIKDELLKHQVLADNTVAAARNLRRRGRTPVKTRPPKSAS